MAVQKITVDQGTTKKVEFLHYINEQTSGNEFNLSGYTAKLWVRGGNAYGPVVLKLDNRLTVGTTNGKVTLDVLPADTSSLKFVGDKLVGFYNLEISNGTTTYRTFEGPFEIRKEVITE